MPLKLPRKIALPAPGSLTDPSSSCQVVPRLLLACSTSQPPPSRTTSSTHLPKPSTSQLASAIAQRQALQAQLTRTRTLAYSVDRGKQEGENSSPPDMMNRRHTYSTIINELNETAQSAGMDKAGDTFPLDPIHGSDDLDMMSISLTLEGNYAQLVKFVNLLDRSPAFPDHRYRSP